ncbi:hypothetical protein AB0M12_22150 [Nocardia vinacea]|uniref:hypothetical protein n=1 Tax=Nocardia vinacea TaxID=96468 RepID=UPI00343EE247
MAPTDDKPNPWQLSGDDIGKDSQNLTVKQKSLQTLAKYAIDLYDVFDTIEGWTHFVEKVDGFGNLPSGIALQGKFQRAGRDLNDRAKSHKTILEDLAQQFITAGKLYTAAEEANTSGFDRLRNARSAERHGSWSLPADGTTKIPDWGGKTGRTDKYGGPPADLKQYANEKDGRDTEPVRPEPASVLDYPTAYSWHQSLINGMGHTSDASGIWSDMAEHVTGPAANLGNQMTAMQTSDDWNSDAAVKAGGAVQAYVSGVQNMVEGMRIVASNLLNTSGWLWAVQANTPNIPPDTVGTQYARDEVDKAKRIFNDWYVPGLAASSNAIPLMVQPVSPVVQPTAPTPSPTRTQQTGPGGGTGGTGSGKGGTSAAQSQAAQQALADQRKATQQAEKTAAEQRQQAEQQRQQAEREAAQREAAQQRATQQQAAEQAAQQAAQQASQSAQQGLDGVKQAMDQAAQAAAQQAQAAAAKDMQSAGLAGLPSALSALGKDALKAGGGSGAGKSGGAGGGAGSGAGANLSSNSLQNSKLFPRAAAAEMAGAATASRAGIASTGQPGSPGGMGPAGHGAGGQNKEHKRAAYLDSVEHIEEALGDAQVVVKPVVEQ